MSVERCLPSLEEAITISNDLSSTGTYESLVTLLSEAKFEYELPVKQYTLSQTDHLSGGLFCLGLLALVGARYLKKIELPEFYRKKPEYVRI